MQELQLCHSCLSLGENNGAETLLLLPQGQQHQDFNNYLQAKTNKQKKKSQRDWKKLKKVVI